MARHQNCARNAENGGLAASAAWLKRKHGGEMASKAAAYQR
jgi:hypothetical protein